VKRGEVDRHVAAEPVDDPVRHPVDLLVGVVESGDKQRRDLKPDVRLVLDVLERVEHRLQVAGARARVEGLAERLEVDVRRVHVREELAPRLVADIAGRDGDGADPALAARVGDIDRVLHEDHGIVVGERDARALQALRGVGEGRGRGGVGERVHLARFRDVPVLTEAAAQVAAGRAEREHRRAR
jgi:hypothetical protein